MKITDDIEACYPAIGQAAVDLVPSDFTRLWVFSEIFDGVSTTALYYRTPDNSNFAVYDGLDALDSVLNDLHDMIAAAGNETFSGATFTMEADCKFSLTYSYGDVSDLASQSERLTTWQYEHLGDVVLKYV